MIQEQISKTRHSERCPKCKDSVREILEKIYGKVEQNYKFEINLSLQRFSNTKYYNKLQEIYKNLQNHRSFKEFVKAKTLPNCDFFVPNPGFIVEFDESQHFTPLRRLALEDYPEELKLGFDKKKWISLCNQINARDNDPPYRDEQRAWYDTLRDFLPAMKNLKPTIRLFSKDLVWCDLNPNNPSDINKFKEFLEEKSNTFKIEIKEDTNPFLARIIIAGQWDGKPNKAKKLFEQVYKNWPEGRKVKFIITCGGFIQFDWPESITRKDAGDNKYPNDKVVSSLVKSAEECAEFILSEGLNDKLRKITDYITLGIDSYKEKISTTQNYINQLHIELVILVDLINNKFYWVGKSYPTPSQQNGLIRIPNLKTHFLDLNGVGKLMILGCHDLTMFNPRSKNAKGWRKKVNEEFKELVRKEKPEIVLQHPHTTDSVRTWAAAWSGLIKNFPFIKIFASSGRYYNYKGVRSKLNDILKKTKHGSTIDIIVNTNHMEVT